MTDGPRSASTAVHQPHDWRWGMIDGGNGPGRRTPIAVCWHCDWVAWNEVDYEALENLPCPRMNDAQWAAAEVNGLMNSLDTSISLDDVHRALRRLHSQLTGQEPR